MKTMLEVFWSSKSLKLWFYFIFFFISSGLNQTFAQNQEAVNPETSIVSDQQWLNNIKPYFSGSLSKQHYLFMKIQLSLTDEQVQAIKTFGQMIGTLNQNSKEEWNVETLPDRSGGKISSNAEKIEEAKAKVLNNQDHLNNSVHDFRTVLGSKEKDFVTWIKDDAFIESDVSLVTQRNKGATAEEVANEVSNDMRQKLTDRNWSLNEYQKWIIDRAKYESYRFLILQSAVLKDKSKFNQLKNERAEHYKQMISQ